jgi:hypothetical protein
MTLGFEKINEGRNEDNNRVPCVFDVKTEHNHYIVSIVWKNGEVSAMHFPENGFDVVNPLTGEKIRYIKGYEAVKILRDNVSEYNREDFSWIHFVNNK